MTDVTEENETYEETPTERPNTFENIEEEGDIAADYLEELLDIADIDGDIDIEVRNQRTYLAVLNDEDNNEELRQLVGRNGQVLEALQELVRLSVLAASGNRSRLILDVAGYRAERREQLADAARQAVEEVRESGEDYHMNPLGAYERKIVHDIVAEQGLYSESEGRARPVTLLFRSRRYKWSTHPWMGKTRLPLNKSLVTVCRWHSVT